MNVMEEGEDGKITGYQKRRKEEGGQNAQGKETGEAGKEAGKKQGARGLFG